MTRFWCLPSALGSKEPRRPSAISSSELRAYASQSATTIFAPPPFFCRSCAGRVSFSGIHRLIYRAKRPSRTSSANSRSFDTSGRAKTRGIWMLGKRSVTSSGRTEAQLHRSRYRSHRPLYRHGRPATVDRLVPHIDLLLDPHVHVSPRSAHRRNKPFHMACERP